MESREPLGLVLAGGLSARMGTDKGLLNYHGKPQREYLFELLSKFCARVFTSCRKDQEVPSTLNPIVDSFNYPGPINGILSAFQSHPNSPWLIVAVDMPFVSEAVLELLIKNRDESKLATCFLHTHENFPEPLLTLWEPSAYSSLQRFVESGKISPRAFLECHDVMTILAPDEKVLLNINYPNNKL